MPAKKDPAAEGPDPDHLAILRRGVTEWNAWRKVHPEVLRDLAGANLRNEDLSGANLSRGDLRGANLSAANLSRTDLCLANLFGAKISEAKLGGADFSGADLREATGASSSDLSGIGLPETRFLDTDLRNVPGLEQARHDGQSTLDHGTPAKSGPLPEGFLTAIDLPGMPDHSIRVEFSESVWRDLFVVEFGLREVLGDEACSLDKHDDRLTVTFRSPEDFQKGLEVVVAQLAAQEQVKPGVLDAFKLKETDEPVEIEGERLRRLLASVAEELCSVKEDTQRVVGHEAGEDEKALTLWQETLHGRVDSLPTKFGDPLVRRLLEERNVRTREGSMLDIYDRSILGFHYVNRRRTSGL